MATNIDSAFQASPAGGDNPAQGDDKIREFKVAMYERWLKEHNMDLAEGGAQPRQGLHKAGSAVAFYQASAPTQRNGVALATVDAGLLWLDSDTGALNQWSGSVWVDVAVNTTQQIISAVATGTAPLVVASTTKVDNLNADSIDGYGVTAVGNGLRAIHGSLAGAGVSEDDIFDALVPALTALNDSIAVSGCLNYTPIAGAYTIFVVARATRTASNIIVISGVANLPSSSAGSVANITCTNGDASTFNYVSLAW